MSDNNRQKIGRTTEQIKNAPRNATFIYGPYPTDYARDLARYLGRTDLRIVEPRALLDGRCHGLAPGYLILDHAARLTLEELETLRMLTVRDR